MVLNAAAAAGTGALVLTRSPATSARRENGARTLVTRNSQTGETRDRCSVNCAGPRVSDVIGQAAGSNATRNVRLVNGIHRLTRQMSAALARTVANITAVLGGTSAGTRFAIFTPKGF